MAAVITYNPRSQKRGEDYYDRLLTKEILDDICQKVTGQADYLLVRNKADGYNKGRLLTIDHDGHRYYVTISEIDNKGRNSNVQSVPTVVNTFYADDREKKTLCYYFMPHEGNLFSDYYVLFYRLMATVGFVFLNADVEIRPYADINELIMDRRRNSGSNRSNNSSYLTVSGDKTLVYGKVYGANKYESTLLGVVAALLSKGDVEFYNVCEKDLKNLPEKSLHTFGKFKNLKVHDTSLYFDRKQYVDGADDSKLRSQSYIYNIYQRLGDKKCAFCDCSIPEIIHGAHIWNVADIAGNDKLTREQKFNMVNSGHNGIWLCQNHHKLFDCNILMLDEEGKVRVKPDMDRESHAYIKRITTLTRINCDILSSELINCLRQRNRMISLETSLCASEM